MPETDKMPYFFFDPIDERPDAATRARIVTVIDRLLAGEVIDVADHALYLRMRECFGIGQFWAGYAGWSESLAERHAAIEAHECETYRVDYFYELGDGNSRNSFSTIPSAEDVRGCDVETLRG